MSRTSLCLKEHSLRQTEHAFCVVDRSLRQLILGLSRLSLLAPAGVYDVIRFLTGQSERVVEDNKSAVPSRSLPPLVSPTALFLLSTHTHTHTHLTPPCRYHELEGGNAMWALEAMTGDHVSKFRHDHGDG